MPRELSKCREWEKERRDRLSKCFTSLSKLLPCYDPSLPISKINILEKAAAYIEELQLKVKDLLSSESVNKVERDEIKKLCERIKKLILRNEQLANLLKDAGIKVPSECGKVKRFKKAKPWSNRISPEQAKLFAEKENEKENAKTAPKKLKPKTKAVKSGIQQKRKRAAVLKKNAGKTPTSNCIIILSQPAVANTQNCYIITNAPSSHPLPTLTKSSTVVTNSTLLSAPLVTATVKPTLTHQVTKKNALSSLGPGTLILANGSIVPVLPPPAAILPPNPTILTNTAPLLLNQQAIVVVTTVSLNSNTVSQAGSKNLSFSNNRGLAYIKPKRCTTKTVQANKVPIPALTSRHANTSLVFSTATVKNQLKGQPKKVGEKTAKVDKVIDKKPDQLDGSVSKRKLERSEEDVLPTKQTRVEEGSDKNTPQVNVTEAGTNTPDVLNNDDKIEQKKVKSYSIDSLCEEKEENHKLHNEKSAKEPVRSENNDTGVQIQTTETVISNITTTTTTAILPVEAATTAGNPPTFVKTSSKIDEIPDNVLKEIENTQNNKTQKTDITENKGLEIGLQHSELSNDIFASLQVQSGSQNPESTSPTAAFLLAFPLVSTLTGVKVSEVIEEDNSDSQRGTPTLLQIGTMDSTKPTQSGADNLTPSLLNLDNFSFFSSKDICSSFYQPFDNFVATTTTVSVITTASSCSEKCEDKKKPATAGKDIKVVYKPANTKDSGFTSSAISTENFFNKTDVSGTPSQTFRNQHNCLQTPFVSNNTTDVNKQQEQQQPQLQRQQQLQQQPLQQQQSQQQQPSQQQQQTQQQQQPPPQQQQPQQQQQQPQQQQQQPQQLLQQPPPQKQQQQKTQPQQQPQQKQHQSQNVAPVLDKPAVTQENSSIHQRFHIASADSGLGTYSNNYNSNYVPSFYNTTSQVERKQGQLHKNKCSMVNSYSTPGVQQCNTFNPFAETVKHPAVCSYNPVTKSYVDSLYTSTSTYNYSSQSDASFTQSNYNVNKTAHKMDDKSYYNVNYSNSYNTDSRNNSFSNNYCQMHNLSNNNKDKFGVQPNKSKPASNQTRPPVNWMTTPDIRHQHTSNDYLLPCFSKDLDTIPNSAYTNSTFSVHSNTQTTYFNTNTSIYPAPELTYSLTEAKRTLESTFPAAHIASFQRNDLDDNQFTWSPTKLPLLDPSHSFVSSALPTLVGDLALGNTSASFLEQKSESASKTKELYNKQKDVRRNKPSNYDSHANFLSVSQLVDHNKEGGPARTTARRNSGNRSNKPPVQQKPVKRKDGKDSQHYHSAGAVKTVDKNHMKQSQIVQNSTYNLSHNNQEWLADSAKQNQVKNPSSSYSAEALIGHQSLSEEVGGKQRNTVQEQCSYTVASTLPVPFLTENLISYFPSVEYQQETTFGQNQNCQNNSFTHNMSTASVQTNTYSSGSLIVSAPAIATNYLSTGNFMADISSHDFNPVPSENLNPFSHSSAGRSDGKVYVKHAVQKHLNRQEERKVAPAASTNCSGSNIAKKPKKKHSNENAPGFVDFSFLSTPGAINSPFLPDDFHTSLLPSTPQLYSCKNPLYPKQNTELNPSALLPLPPVPVSRSNIQHPEISPSVNNGGSLTNFNLSAIFPEINKGSAPLSDTYSDHSRARDYNSHRNNIHTTQVPFANKTTVYSSSAYSFSNL